MSVGLQNNHVTRMAFCVSTEEDMGASLDEGTNESSDEADQNANGGANSQPDTCAIARP